MHNSRVNYNEKYQIIISNTQTLKPNLLHMASNFNWQVIIIFQKFLVINLYVFDFYETSGTFFLCLKK